MELSLLNLKSIQKLHQSELAFETPKNALKTTLIMARSWEQFKQKEHRASVEQCLADKDKLRLFNEMDSEGNLRNELYKGFLASKWLSSITHLLSSGGPEAGIEDFISHT